jgi:hypothetical protein
MIPQALYFACVLTISHAAAQDICYTSTLFPMQLLFQLLLLVVLIQASPFLLTFFFHDIPLAVQVISIVQKPWLAQPYAFSVQSFLVLSYLQSHQSLTKSCYDLDSEPKSFHQLDYDDQAFSVTTSGLPFC